MNLIEDYEIYASVYDDDAAYYLGSLFASPDAPVLCDIIGVPQYQNVITISEYMKILMTYSMNTNIIVRDVKKGEMEYSDGLWHIPVTFKKDLAYIDKEGYYFSVSEYHSEEFQVTMNLSYDPHSDICLIESIDADISSRRKFPQGRFVILNENKNPDKSFSRYFSQMTFGDSEVAYNSYGQAIISDKPSGINDPDVQVLCDTLLRGFNYDVVSYGFKLKNKRLKLRYGIAPISAYKVTNPYNGVSDKSMAMEFGVDFGLTWPIGQNSKMGVNIGAGISTSSLTLTLNGGVDYAYEYSIYDPMSMLFKDHVMNYKVSSASEKIVYQDFIMPLYLSFEHVLSPMVMLSCDLGLKGYFPLGAHASEPYSFVASADGTNITIDGEKRYIEANTYVKDKQFDMSIIGNLGVDVNVLENKLYCSVKVGYEHGVTSPVYSSNTNRYFSSKASIGTGIYPVIYDPISRNHIPVHSLISGVSFNRRAIWLSAGLKVKL